MNTNNIYRNLFLNIKNNNYQGWDPYDILNSKFLSNINAPQKILLLLTQFNRISPINFRPLLNIKKDYNSKAMALIAQAVLQQGIHNNNTDIVECINWLISFKSEQFDEYSIGFKHDIVLSHYTSKRNSPSLIITLFALYAFIEYWNKFNDKMILNYIHSSYNLIQKRLPKYEDNNILWYSYNFDKLNEIYNATAKIGKFYALLYSITHEKHLLEKISKILNYLLVKQRIDGSWPYGEHIHYTDGFHTAFVLEAIWYMRHLVDNKHFSQMFALGLQHYKDNLFNDNGQPLYFHPYYKPKDIRSILIETDIRDCAMSIVLFNLLDDQYFLNKTLDWTLHNMYSFNNKYFYYYKNKFWTNKIEFIRWQAWMLYALSNL